MKSLVLTLALLASSFPVIADDEDINWYRVTANGLLIVDMLQTVEISKNENFTELNQSLGTYPTEREVYQYFALSLLFNNFIGELLPKKYNKFFYTAVSMNYLEVIDQNIQFGIKIRL